MKIKRFTLRGAFCPYNPIAKNSDLKPKTNPLEKVKRSYLNTINNVEKFQSFEMIIEEKEDESDYDDPDYENLDFDSDEEIKILKKVKFADSSYPVKSILKRKNIDDISRKVIFLQNFLSN